MKKTLLISLLLSISASYAETLVIPDDQSLNAEFLDKAWANREDTANQKVIANYLLTKPTIPQNYEAAWKTARLVSFIGNYGYGETVYTAKSAGVPLFDYGVNAGKLAMQLNANGVEGYYWYAADLGSYGLAKGIMSAAGNAGKGMDALRKASQINPSYQNYGSSRILGRYYYELPGIMGGSNKKALTYLTEATEKAADYRNNWLYLGQFYLASNEYQQALDACTKAANTKDSDGKYENIRTLREANSCVKKAQAKLSS